MDLTPTLTLTLTLTYSAFRHFLKHFLLLPGSLVPDVMCLLVEKYRENYRENSASVPSLLHSLRQCMDLTNMAEASNITCDPEDGADTLLSWLKRASLEKYPTMFAENGITEIAHLEDVKEEDAISLGLTKFDAR